MRIIELLGKYGKNASQLAKASGVSRQAIANQLGKAKIGKNAWIRIREGLRKLDIDPVLVRPEESSRDPAEDLRHLVFGWSADQLRSLEKILMAHPLAQGKLLFYIDGKLNPPR